jgi:hypothetical protein
MGRKSSKKYHKILPKEKRYCQFIVELNNKVENGVVAKATLRI